MKINEPKIEAALKELLKCVRESEVYGEYKELNERIRDNTEEYELVRKAQSLRKQIHELNKSGQNEGYAEMLHSEYEDLIDNTVVYKYEHAQLKLGETVKDIVERIVDVMEE